MPILTTAVAAVTAAVAAPTITPAPTAAATITAFTPDWSCSQNYLSMLGISANMVWHNYPYPASALTETGCYPESILASLATPFALPPLSPLVIPDWYSVITMYTNNYFVACPSSYSLHLAGSGVPEDRPASGALCYSNLPNPTSVTAFDNITITATQDYTDPTAQAFALVLDGYSEASSHSSLAAPTNTLPPSSATTITPLSGSISASPSALPSKKMTGGAIAGTVIGVFAGVGLLGATVLALMRRYQTKSDLPPDYSEAGHDTTPPFPEMMATDEVRPKVHELSTDIKDPMERTMLSKRENKVTDETLELPAVPRTPTGSDHGEL